MLENGKKKVREEQVTKKKAASEMTVKVICGAQGKEAG